MKVLLRQYDDKYYVWKEAEFTKDGYIIDGTKFNYTSILDAQTEEGVTYVTCVTCGALIKNTPKDIEAHYAEREAERNCLQCRLLRERNSKNETVEYNKQKDGTYEVIRKRNSALYCYNCYYGSDIDDLSNEDLHSFCDFYKCRRRGVRSCNNIFITLPHLFETQITVDVLIEKKLKYEGCSRRYFEYEVKGTRGNVAARVNEMGIVDHYVLRYRNYYYILYYSAKYDKLFYECGGNYEESLPYGIPAVKWDQVKEKIAALYKEEDK